MTAILILTGLVFLYVSLVILRHALNSKGRTTEQRVDTWGVFGIFVTLTILTFALSFLVS
jgi:hypothetical protein